MTAPDIAILGGGPIGLACALLLAQRRFHCVVLDARPLEAARRDARLLALSRGTWQLLQPLLDVNTLRRAPIRDVFVSSAGEFGSTHVSSADFDGADLGATVLYGDLLGALAAAAEAQPGIVQRRPCRALRIEQTPARVRVALDDGSHLDAALAVRAEGLDAIAGADAVPANAQVAVIADLRIAGPAASAAYERFTREGPLALLPTPFSALAGGAGTATALVWCMDAAQAARRLELTAADFVRELQDAIGPRVGRVQAVGERRSFPLHHALREEVREHRVVALGNAAQTLHPVAGQGFNLGLRDCATLADAMAAHPGAPLAALAEYERRRRIDRAAIAGLTRWLPPAFATSFAPVALARGAGLVALDLLPPLRRQFAHLLMFGART